MKKNKTNIKSFFCKNRKILIFLLLLLISGGTFYYFVTAESADDNKLTVRNVVISSINDGLAGFDSDDNAGNDSSDKNGRVRNYDVINYTVDLDLVKKNESDNVNTSDKRTIVVDVLVPSSIEGTIQAGEMSGSYELKPVFNDYKYAEFTEQVEVGSKKIDFSLTNINASNGTKINPIVIIKESTDENQKSINELEESQKASNFDSVSSIFSSNKSSCSNTLSNNETSCETEVTGIEKYFVNLYHGSMTKDNLNTNIPVGILIGLESRKTSSNEDKGIKGLLIPSNVSFDINALALSSGTTLSYVNNSARSYKSNGDLNYKIFIDDSNSVELPEVILDDYKGNGDITATLVNQNNKLIHVDINNIKNRLNSLDGNNTYYLSTNSFEINSARSSYDQAVRNIDIKVSATNTAGTLSEITITDNYSRFVGTYESKVNIYDSIDDISAINPKQDGMANLNYNEEFYINTNFQYGIRSGDGLENLTNYIKIDNDAILLTLLNGVEYQANTGVTNSDYSAPSIDSVMFGYGKWTSEYFTVANNAPEGCPTDLSTLSKENLMNLYGGPCIEAAANKVKWSSNFDGLDDNGNPILTDAEKEYGPIIVRSIYTPDGNGEYVYPTSTGNIVLRAKVKDNYNLANNAYQIVTSATGMFKDDSGNSSLYYLSNQNNVSNIEVMKNPNNFVKTDYDFANKKVNTLNTTTCEGTTTCSATGNTILVSGVRVSKPQVNTYLNDVDTTNFYYYPIEWRINANAYRNDSDTNTSFEGARVYVYIPEYLNYISYGNKDGYKEPSRIDPITYEGQNYTRLIYDFDQTEVSTGKIPQLSVYTNIYLDTPNNMKPKVLVKSDFTVKKRIENTDGTYREIIFNAINPDMDRTTIIDNVTVHNNSDITMQGVTIPTYFEKNGSYNFEMKVYNNSSSNDEGFAFKNSALYYVLPYNNDSAFDDLSSKFTATGFKIKLSALPTGYKAYYTNGVSSNIISNEIDDTTNKGYTWIEWTNPTSEISDATAIKIVKTSDFDNNSYFGGENGIIATVTPLNSKAGDTFYNLFYLLADRPSNLYCKDTESDEENICDSSTKSNKIYYTSSRSMASVYNRQISGMVFEDYDYSGLFDNNESRLENIPVSIYKLKDPTKEYDNNNPASYVDEADWVADTTTNVNGEYVVRGLSEGKYFVKFTYDNEKYTPTDKDVSISTSTDTNVTNSKAMALPKGNVAISSIITFTNDSPVRVTDINLGLKIRKQFVVDINKYITNVTVTSRSGTDSYDYKNATEVTLNVKNPRNTTAKVKYSFVVENTKYFPGYVGIIADRMPAGMTFNPQLKENQDWVLYGNTLYYTGLSGRLLIPNTKYYFDLVLDLDITEGGTYTNIVAVRDLILMGEEISSYDFSSLDLFSDDTNQNNNTENNNNNQNGDTSSNEGNGE